MLVELEQSTVLEMMSNLGKEAWFLYSGLQYMNVDGIVNITHAQIAELLGVSEKYVQRHIKVLQSYRVGESALVRAVRTSEGYSYVMTPIKVDVGSAPLLEPKKKKTKAKTNPTNELFDYWLQQYHDSYDTSYPVTNFGKEKGHIRTLSLRYGGDVNLVKAIIDVVIRLYPTRWKSTQFQRPTLGALVSWLAAQAEPLAKANLDAKDDQDVVITNEDGDDVFAAYDKKWGLD